MKYPLTQHLARKWAERRGIDVIEVLVAVTIIVALTTISIPAAF